MKAKTLNLNNQSSHKLGFDFKNYSTLLALLGLFLILGLLTDGSFLSARNFTNLTRQISVNGILASGMTLVILTSGIDLSVGSVVALSGIICGILQVNFGFSEMGVLGAALSILASMGTGLLAGILNGGLISVFKIPPFVITLGMMVIARGLALILSDSSAISPLSSELKWLAKGFVSPTITIGLAILTLIFWLKTVKKRINENLRSLKALFASFLIEGACLGTAFTFFIQDRGIPIPALIMISLALLGMILLHRYPLGRYIYSIGGNEEAAELSGVPVTKVKWIVYSLIGLLSGLCGVLLASRLNSATPTEGQLMELDAIAAVVIGGTSLMGGLGTIRGSLIGAFLIGTLNNGMDILEIDSNFQMVIKGLIIILAVWFDAKNKKKA